MPANQLTSLLAEGNIAPDNVHRLARLCDELFDAEPSLTNFILRSVFRELSWKWDDTQGIPTSQYAPFRDKFLPLLKKLAADISAKPKEEPLTDLKGLVKAFRDCCRLADTRANDHSQ